MAASEGPGQDAPSVAQCQRRRDHDRVTSRNPLRGSTHYGDGAPDRMITLQSSKSLRYPLLALPSCTALKVLAAGDPSTKLCGVWRRSAHRGRADQIC